MASSYKEEAFVEVEYSIATVYWEAEMEYSMGLDFED